MNLQNAGPEIWLDTGRELFFLLFFLFNNDCIILTLVITDWKSELRINGTILIFANAKVQKYFYT